MDLAPTTALAPVMPVRTDDHPAFVYLARLAPGSRRAMAQALAVIAGLLSHGRADAESLPWHRVRYQHAQAVRSALEARYSPSAGNKILSALRGVLTEAFRLGLMTGEDYHRAVAIGGFKGPTPLRGRALKPGEISALLDVCDATTAQGARDVALLALLYGAGLRRSEAVALQLTDYDP